MIPFRHILVPLDGSELAEKALAPAGQVAAAMSRGNTPGSDPVRLVLLRVASPVALLAADPLLYDEMVRMSVDEAQTYLNNVVASRMTDHPAIIETVTQVGSSADAIVQYAEDHGVDLIVMSSHGRTGSSRWVYGSVAEKVMHHAPCATAIIRAHVEVAMFQNRKLLVPLDGSELAERALEPALAMAGAVQSDALLLRVVVGREPLPEAMTPAGDQAKAALEAATSQEMVEAEAYLQKIYTGYDNQRLFFDVKSTEGDIADAIISYADGHGVDLIVISSHGRSGLGRWLHGSVAEKVLRGANCATLIIRGSQS